MSKHIIVTINIPKQTGPDEWRIHRESVVVNINTTVIQDLFDWAKECGITSPSINDFVFSEAGVRWGLEL